MGRWDTNTAPHGQSRAEKQVGELIISWPMRSTGTMQEQHKETPIGTRICTKTSSPESRWRNYTTTHRRNTRYRLQRTQGNASICHTRTTHPICKIYPTVPRTRAGSSANKKLQSNEQHQETFDNSTQEWFNYKNKLGEALQQIYSLSKKQTRTEEPEWVTKLEKWVTEQEIRQLD